MGPYLGPWFLTCRVCCRSLISTLARPFKYLNWVYKLKWVVDFGPRCWFQSPQLLSYRVSQYRARLQSLNGFIFGSRLDSISSPAIYILKKGCHPCAGPRPNYHRWEFIRNDLRQIGQEILQKKKKKMPKKSCCGSNRREYQRLEFVT